MRKLAREAIIFTVISALITGVSMFFLLFSMTEARWDYLLNPVPNYLSSIRFPLNNPEWNAAVIIVGMGYYGVPVGISLWFLYRLVRFAIKG
jgi:hypothetical protein